MCRCPFLRALTFPPPPPPPSGTPTSPATSQLAVPFTLPTDLGSPAITSVSVVCVESSIASPSCASTGPGVYTGSAPINASPLQASLTGVAGGIYVCFAGATNVAGSACSTASTSVTVSGPPSAPIIGTAVSSAANAIDVSFTASVSPGVPPVSSYTVKCVNVAVFPSPTCADTGAGVLTTTVSTSASPLVGTVTGAATTSSWKCFAIANNGVAPGDVCSAASNLVTASGPPTAPTISTPVSTAVGALTVPFTASTK